MAPEPKRLIDLIGRATDRPLFNYFIPEEIHDQGAIAVHRARMLLLFMFVMVVFIPPFVVVYGVMYRIVPVAAILMAGTIPSIIGPFVLKVTGRPDLVSHFICLNCLLVVAGASIYNGGMTGPSIPWMLIVPVYALIFGGPRSGMIWGAISTATVAGLYAAELHGIYPLQTLPESVLVYVTAAGHVTLILFTMGLFAFQKGLTQWLVEELRDANDRLETQALFDRLTGLANRVLLRDRMSQAVERLHRRSESFGLAFIDLDDFKAVNDSLGHAAGDALLERVADRLTETVRSEDTVARVGGDEFVILCTNASAGAAAETTMRRLREAFEPPFEIETTELHLSASIGFVTADSESAHGESVEAVVDRLIATADTAMYEAKRRPGTTSKLSGSGVEEGTPSLIEMENDIRAGLETGQFQPHYQPIFDLETRRVTALEVLARWNHPERGSVSPGEFISVAERSRLIHRIGETILEEVAEQLSELAIDWRDREVDIYVNLSPRQLDRIESIRRLEQIIEREAPPGLGFKFEVTENDLLRIGGDPTAFGEMKHGIVIDDFGTGYASLSRLKEIEVDALKIDMSFVHGVTDDAIDLAIVRNIIDLGARLDLPVVGEGVETREQFDALREAGCTTVQGYYLGRPQDIDALAEWLPLGAAATPPDAF